MRIEKSGQVLLAIEDDGTVWVVSLMVKEPKWTKLVGPVPQPDATALASARKVTDAMVDKVLDGWIGSFNWKRDRCASDHRARMRAALEAALAVEE